MEMRTTDPWRVLELEPGAGDDQIREAYLAKVRQFPPEREPAAFEQVRDAYETLRDPRRRARHVLAADPNRPLESLLEGRPARRRFAGPDAWMAVLRVKP